ncbi:uncharacterized protein LOC134203324 [Armigeres subalbatus]|uniref:uncharacterized protein LOC134203324 n=1 Tax=Armigeres subalbatus TaxID=124917 RepID=UPI002ED61A58
MDYTHLTDEEVTYELALRHVVNLGPTTHRGKILRLKALVQEETLRDSKPTSSDHVMSPQSNIEHCESHINKLHISAESALHTADSEAICQIRSRLLHYRDRLLLIRPPVELHETHAMLTMQISVLLNKVNGKSVVHGASISDSAVNQLQSTGAVRRCNAEEEGAFGDAADATFPMVNNVPLENPSPVSNQLPQMNSLSGGHRRGLLSANQQSCSPPPPYHSRERAAWNHPEGGAQGLDARIREMQDRERRIREEYCRMRDELDRLIRREQPRPAREEERRLQKAVHNWPFKFRGDKDTTSLNVFLDRVETFARSEGMSATLLSSIKHLLQEDAIVTAARPRSLEEMVEVCTGYDETRMAAILPQQQQPHRYNRVHAVEIEDNILRRETEEDEARDTWQHSIDELVEQVNALKLNMEKSTWRSSNTTRNDQQPRFADRIRRPEEVRQPVETVEQHRMQPQRQQLVQYQQRQPQQLLDRSQRTQNWQSHREAPNFEEALDHVPQQSHPWHPEARREEIHHDDQREIPRNQRPIMVCWNCDEDGHRFMDCPKPQAILFCYRCGRKGYSLRSCFTCRADAGNGQAGNRQ